MPSFSFITLPLLLFYLSTLAHHCCLYSMEPIMKDMLSNITSARTTTMEEGSDSNSSSSSYQASKRQKLDSSSNSSFKGVVKHSNGHWGAQIYVNHQRIWLGTFKTENDAAMAYDSASLMLRSEDPRRNFPFNSITVQEPHFQVLFRKDAILSMIKDGSYQSKFMDFLRTRNSQMENAVELKLGKEIVNEEGYSCQLLFQKELTPSDVGKLNRLVIPKKHAIKYFPQVSEVNSGEDEEAGGVDDVQLVFYDRMRKSWKFRYCYWKSSQSFVFTRGWNRFVKEKDLKAKDNVVFYRCENSELLRDNQVFYMIDVHCIRLDMGNSLVEEPARYPARKMGLHLDLSGSFETDFDRIKREEEEKVVIGLGLPLQEDEKIAVRVFGVQIN